jgi:hypothetical protein
MAAPWAISGGHACAASPITIARPRNHGSSTSSHPVRVYDTLESGPMVSLILPQVPPHPADRSYIGCQAGALPKSRCAPSTSST